ncbi:MAG: amino acid ABC transporter permease [Candidatus Methylomirabilales bacterium]
MNYSFHFEVFTDHLPQFFEGGRIAFELVGLAMAIGFVLGAFGAVARRSKNKIAYGLATGYVELFRNTPLLVQLYLVYFGLPELGISISSYPAALLALSLNNGAYLTEIERAGMEAIHKNEIEAGLALGMSYPQVLIRIVLPHVFRIIYPPFASQTILIFLGTSLTGLIAVPELTYQARILEAETFRPFEIYAGLGILYVIGTMAATWILVLLGRWLFKIRVKVF